MAKRKNDWNEKGSLFYGWNDDGTFNEEAFEINKKANRIESIIEEKQELSDERKLTEMGASERHIQRLRESDRPGDRADASADKVGHTGRVLEQGSLFDFEEGVLQYGRRRFQGSDNSISNADNSKMGETASTDGLRGRDKGQGSSGFGISSERPGETGTLNLWDKTSQNAQGDGEYGFGNTQDSQHQSLSSIHRDNERLSAEREFSVSAGASGQRSLYILKSTGVNEDFTTTESEVFFTGKKDKFQHNLEAIKKAKELNEYHKLAFNNGHEFTITKSEQQTLSKFDGWGSIPEVFDERKDDWEKEREELKRVLTEEEYETARASTTSAFYTPKIVIDTIYKALDQMGINNDTNKKKMLEPSAGNGSFLSYAKNYSNNYDFTTVEKDIQSHNFLKLLYPKQKHNLVTFESYCPKDIKFDAVIGNPPFGSIRLSDKEDTELTGILIHNFFASKSQNLLKKDGICAFVIDDGFMDAKDEWSREYISKKSTFLGAVRLPDNVFKNSGTKVTTDIVFFKEGVDSSLSNDWLKTQKYNGTEFAINEYFLKHPENVLGKLEIDTNAYGKFLTCKPNPNLDLEAELDRFIKSLPKDIYKYHELDIKDNILVLNDKDAEYTKNKAYLDGLKDGNYLVFKDEIYMKAYSYDDGAIVLEKQELSKLEQSRVKSFIQMRDTHTELINLEKQDIKDDDERLVIARNRLNLLYDDFHKNGDFLNNSRKSKSLQLDVDFQKIKSLEKNYQKAISPKQALEKGINAREESAEKAIILLRRVIRPKPEIKITTAEEGLYASMNLYGSVNLEFISSELKQKTEDIEKELIKKNRIFLNPTKLKNLNRKEYLLAEHYLSGDVKSKYKEAKKIAKDYPVEMEHNLTNLKSVFPPDLKPTEIEAPMGSAWIPLEYYHQFFEKEFGIKRDNWSLSRSDLSGAWNFRGESYKISLYNLKKYKDNDIDRSIYDIAEAALSNKSLKVTKQTDEPLLDNEGNIRYNSNGSVMYKSVVDAQKTGLINSKVELMRTNFSEWLMKDPDRRMELTEIYNEKFNCYVKKTYDGSNLNLDDLNSDFNLRKHQKDAIFRSLNEQNNLFDHEVGAGKTLTAICSIMKQKQLGLVNKPLIAVPNHLVRQWEDEFMNAYPNANILVAEETSTSPAKREEFFGKIMNGDYDAIIMTHSQLGKIPVPPEVTKKVIGREIDELLETIKLKEQDENASRYSVKQMETRLENKKQALEKLIDEQKKSKMVDFSDFGVDCLVVDESHMFKNLSFSTALTVKGLGNSAGSKKATDLYIITTWMNDNDKKVTFLTGTPISNSLSELYAVSKFLIPDELEKKNIDCFDAWASTFAKIEKVPELDSSAKDYKIVQRLTALNNLPEICSMYSNVADIVTNQDIKKYYKHYVPEVDIVKSVSKISPLQERYIGIQDPDTGLYNEGSIIYRMDNMPEDKSIDNHLKCTSDAKKAGIDFRLIDENAPDFEDTKINNCVKNTVEEYERWMDVKGTQLIFLDIGTPHGSKQLSMNLKIENDDEILAAQEDEIKNDFININDILDSDIDEDFDNEQEADRDSDEKSFFLYGDLYKKLVRAGIPREEIAFIHDTQGSNVKKQELFEKVNRGDIRVLIGSTAKMGAGTNVQEKVTAIHHLDVPWRPSDFIQRNGRVIRQGNKLFNEDPENFRIKEFRYATEKTYDAVSWQIIETKSKSLVNFRKGLVDGRTLEGFEEEAISAAEMKAIATGNPLLLYQVKIKNELDKEEMLYKAFENEIYQSEDVINYNVKKIQYLDREKIKIDNAIEQVKNNGFSEFECVIYKNNRDGTTQKDRVVIPKDDSEETKAKQEMMKNSLKENLELIFSKDKNSIDLFDYKGFKVSGYYDTGKVIFELTNKETNEVIAPENLVYSNTEKTSIFRDQISIKGLFTRLNNSLKVEKLQELNLDYDAEKTTLSKNSEELKQFLEENKTYKNIELLQALRDDYKVIMEELEKSAKNPKYKSSFVSKAEKLQQENSVSKNHDDKGCERLF